MPRPPAASTLYKLIEAGQLARQALLAPLAARGLEAGDDAILLALETPEGEPLPAIEEMTGLSGPPLDAMLARLEDKGLLLRLAVGPEMEPGARLSQQGQAMRQGIADHWAVLEEALTEQLGRKDRKTLRAGLKSIIGLLGR
ncbi:hypothetical protein [Pelagibacterium montanilacus]|uniref:hypothetical protein n=1 Tax=Pelagibacterium montanilacus TaxID=2185280 RepID=UPI000F8C3F64|nr:hypothetical protein [Pelagibacterium montanilacus]